MNKVIYNAKTLQKSFTSFLGGFLVSEIAEVPLDIQALHQDCGAGPVQPGRPGRSGGCRGQGRAESAVYDARGRLSSHDPGRLLK